MWKVMTTCVIIHNMIVQEERDDGIYDGNWKFEDSVVNEDLAPTQSPIALMEVTGDVVPADVIAKQVAHRCSDHPNWKWEAVPHIDVQFLVSVPSFDDLDRLDGIQVGVPSFSSSIWRSAEVPHKAELEKVWLHVDGVPHTLRHFLGLWALGSGRTVDVDLVSLRRMAVVRIQVAMLQAGVLGDPSDEARSIAKVDDVVKFKAFEFRFRRGPTDYILEPILFLWFGYRKMILMREVRVLLMVGMMLWILLSLEWGLQLLRLHRYQEETSIAEEEQLDMKTDVKMDVKLDMELDMKICHGRARRSGRHAREEDVQAGPAPDPTGRRTGQPSNRSGANRTDLSYRMKTGKPRNYPVAAG
ncbi:hypothetical protein QYE76_067977 [Lolium multiflorum]|uniref:DUF4283 domain-containing protein n=1 Tax=Lolium multiflorum TaxID=4521 RepID=A0AAD8SFF6_LOLMU|nr:hypothetical protein QYE76_067977 [Lolium multiflorum]